MLGYLKLPVRGEKYFVILGGPYMQKPSKMHGVKMAVEISPFYDGSKEIDIPTRDFSVPKANHLLAGLIEAVEMITRGELLYVGCMGGRGRTGLFLAVLAKAFGINDPVGYVRKNYYEHAVETEGQKAFVSGFQIPKEVKRMIKIAKWKSYMRLRENLTKNSKQIIKKK